MVFPFRPLRLYAALLFSVVTTHGALCRSLLRLLAIVAVQNLQADMLQYILLSEEGQKDVPAVLDPEIVRTSHDSLPQRTVLDVSRGSRFFSLPHEFWWNNFFLEVNRILLANHPPLAALPSMIICSAPS